jgi:tetratricopeptide (TPR) repeat protein
MTTLRTDPLIMPGMRLRDENPLPQFRDRKTDRHVAVHESLPEEKRHLLGWETGFRVLPYRMQDNYTRQRTPITYHAIVLENEILKATFLPELGGRLISLFHKPLQRELLCRNPVFQPANLAIRNAWFSGGIEWNIGQLGHTFTTCAPLFAAATTDADGEPGLRLYEYERCKKLFWQIDFYLPPNSPWLIAHTRIANPNDADTSTYWWTNIAVPEGRDVRVLAPANKVIYTDMTNGGFDLGLGDMPNLSTFDIKDASYSLHSGSANEYFFQPDSVDMPWEAALDKDGSGLIETSTPRLRYRKLFCWGHHQGGRHWQEFLAPGGQPYIEIQSGLAPTQLHGLNMPARADWRWTQIFGFMQADAERVHAPEWETAWRSVDSVLKSRIDAQGLSQMDALYGERSNIPSTEILHYGSGWGALELERRNGRNEPLVPPSFVFPKSTLGIEQFKWLTLLHDGVLPEQSPIIPPGDWIVQTEWRDLLEASLKDVSHYNWYALLHLGVMRLEHFDAEGAKAAWQASIKLKPSAWAWRNLSALARLQNDEQEALECLHRAWDLNHHTVELAQEYLQALCHTKRFDEARAVYDSLPAAMQSNDRIQILRGRVALELNDLEAVEQVMKCEYAVVREGETELTDLWFEMWYRRMAEASSRELTESEKAEIRKLYPPSARIDFRSIAK